MRISNPVSSRIPGILLSILLILPSTVNAAEISTLPLRFNGEIGKPGGNIAGLTKSVVLKKGDVVEFSMRVVQPSKLPPNARVRAGFLYQPERTNAQAAMLIGKVLHALDGDIYTTFRAPQDGLYSLTAFPEEGEVTLFEGNRWREAGIVDELLAADRKVIWPDGASVDITGRIGRLGSIATPDGSLVIECEPNNAAETAQPIALRNTTDDYVIQVVGGADDIEYFDNGEVGESGDDWLRLEFNGPEPRLLTACLTIPDQQVAARIRVYEVPKEKATVETGKAIPIGKEYEEGKNPNERVHQQQEQHRIAINRNLKPGNVYFLRVEANTPGYGLELRIVKPAPFTDPRHAVRHGLYDHIGQVSSWLNNRPRGASVERRIRDTGNLLGTACMSCHTQSGVWGPAIPFTQGYRPQNAQLFRNLVNICYQSMRPTNVLIDAANNTSLAPLDLGDGPAGTRVAGHSVVSLERYRPARKLQSKQSIRAANFVLQSGDPGGINAAGPGANVGQGVVFNYTGEIVYELWKKTGNPQYFRALEEKVRKSLDVVPKYTDDMAHRIELLKRYFPQDYVDQAANVYAAEEELIKAGHKPRIKYDKPRTSPEDAAKLQRRIERQIQADLTRLRAIQNADGSWGFNPGKKEGNKWKVEGNNKPEPSPTALALIGFEAAGFGPDDPTVEKGVRALLKLQHPSGYWQGQSKTGFVSTSYCLHALSRLFPTLAPKHTKAEFEAKGEETLPSTIARLRRAATIADPLAFDALLKAASHESPLVRFQAMLGLGALHRKEALPVLVAALGDEAKAVREAGHWAFRQTLIDDSGWEQILACSTDKDDYRREAAMQTLLMRVDGVMPEISIKWDQLTGMLARGMNEDAHPAVRAWATQAAWNWWVWNPPVRPAISKAWQDLLSRPEGNTLVENSIRYQSQALFVANGHKANGSRQHQYKELEALFQALSDQLDGYIESDTEKATRMARRVVGIGATFYNTSGGDGGPGQMGYVTNHSTRLFGTAAMVWLSSIEKMPEYQTKTNPLRTLLEGSANVSWDELQQKLIHYSLHGPENLRPIASSSVSDPRSAQLVAVPERIEPLMKQLHRGAMEPPRRPQLSEPILKMYAQIKWVIPDNVDQQREVFGYLMQEYPKYFSADALKAIPEAGERDKIKRTQDAYWYLAQGLGGAIGNNPDLHTDIMLEFLPKSFEHPQEARFWLPSVDWILTHKTKLPDVVPGKLPPIDPLEEVRSRALLLFLDQLKPETEPETRKFAVTMAQRTALRRNPEVLTALEKMLTFEKRKDVVQNAKNVLSQNRSNFVKELADAVSKEKPARVQLADGKLPKEFVDDFVYFRDYVTPEMNRVLRADQRSCFACHGVKGRVPPLELNRPDEAGFLPVAKLLENYRKLQDRVDLNNVPKSKLLRKPLNVQTGVEEGHQGGRRYQPDDPGYQILKNWAANQLRHRKLLGQK